MILTTQAGDPIVTKRGARIATAAAIDPLFGIPIEGLRERIGLVSSDDSKDVAIESVFGIAVDLVETYLDRILRYGSYTETFAHFAGKIVSLKAYPIDTVDVIVYANGQEPPYHFNREAGLVYLDSFIRAHELSISYSGGYRTLPSGILMAVIGTFDNVWTEISAKVGAVSGVGEIKSISVPDVGTISYQSSGTGGGAGKDFGQVPAALLDVLSTYRREKA
jgi:hypothetical protein